MKKKILQTALILAVLPVVLLAAGPDGHSFFNKRGVKAEAHKTGGNAAVDSAVLGVMNWLAVHQDPEGSFSATDFDKNCVAEKCSGKGTFDNRAGLTGLALLVYLGAGHSDTTGKFRTAVSQAVKYLKKNQNPDGSFGARDGGDKLVSSAWAAAALAEYSLWRKDDLSLNAMLSSAAKYILKSRNSGKCWGRTEKKELNDVWTTVWAATALKVMAEAGVAVEKGALAAPGDLFNTHKVTGRKRGEMLRAALAFGGMMAGLTKDREVFVNLKTTVARHAPVWKKAAHAKHCYAFFATHVLIQFGGVEWAGWNRKLRETYSLLQKRGDSPGCLNGSYDPAGYMEKAGGRMFSTIMAGLTLTAYTRYRVFME